MNTIGRTTILALAMAMPVAIHAQRGMGPRAGGNPVAPLIEMRRELNLSARQLTQLDSIERSLLQRNEGIRTRLRTRLDSVQRRGRQLTEEQRLALRAEGDSLRAIRRGIARNDSIARAGALSILTDSQRVRVRERLAERRGFAAGQMSANRGGQRGFRQGPGGRDFGGRMRPGMQGGRMGMGGPGMRPRGRMGAGGVGPQGEFRGRRPPMDGMGPMGGGARRMGPPDGMAPTDDMGMRPRRRMMDGAAPAAPPMRMRRPPPDSGR